MLQKISEKDKSRLRELAKKQLEYANLPIMKERVNNFIKLNGGEIVKPPVTVETYTFEEEFMTGDAFKCEGETARRIEWQFLNNIRRHELIDDDQPIPFAFLIGWNINVDRYGFNIETEYSADDKGREVGYRQKHPIDDLEKDFDFLKPIKITLDKKATLDRKAFLEELLADIMPVEICNPSLEIHLTSHFINLMGMELFYTGIYDYPEKIEWLFKYICDNQRVLFDFYEKNGLLTLNNGIDHIATSYTATDLLPQKDYSGTARLKDLWIWAEAEETAGLSPTMFKEFILPYFIDMCKLFGRIYYGCCEPMQGTLTEILEKIPNVGKVSVSNWNDEQKVGEILAGKKVVYSRKPSANFIGVDEILDEDAFKKHIQNTIDAARGCPLEFVFRDIYTVHNNLSKAKRGVEIVRELTE